MRRIFLSCNAGRLEGAPTSRRTQSFCQCRRSRSHPALSTTASPFYSPPPRRHRITMHRIPMLPAPPISLIFAAGVPGRASAALVVAVVAFVARAATFHATPPRSWLSGARRGCAYSAGLLISPLCLVSLPRLTSPLFSPPPCRRLLMPPPRRLLTPPCRRLVAASQPPHRHTSPRRLRVASSRFSLLCSPLVPPPSS